MISTFYLVLLENQKILCCQNDCGQVVNYSQSHNCCQSYGCCQTGSICSQITTCQNNCQVRCRTTTCNDQCRSECCAPTLLPTPAPTPAPTLAPIPEPIPKSAPWPTPVINESSNSSSSVNNKNDDNIATVLTLNNVVTNENHINIPVNISNTNQQSVHVVISSPDDPHSERDRERIINANITEKVPVFIPIPGPQVPVYYPVPFPVRIPEPVIIPGCCNVIIPCIMPCIGFERICNHQCTYPFMFTPLNPCHGGCYKRSFATINSCFPSGYCQHNIQDCSQCSDDFYSDYGTYQQCGGCFYN